MTPNTDPKGNKTDQGAYSPSLTPPSQWTLPAPSLECSTLCSVSRVRALSQGTGAGPLSRAPKCFLCLDHFFIRRWTPCPVLGEKQLQIPLRSSTSFP